VDAGARAHHELAAGEEIDWVALAKGRHTYKQRLQRGEVTALSANGNGSQLQQEQQEQQQEESQAQAQEQESASAA
jgi:hypothetical protein